LHIDVSNKFNFYQYTGKFSILSENNSDKQYGFPFVKNVADTSRYTFEDTTPCNKEMSAIVQADLCEKIQARIK